MMTQARVNAMDILECAQVLVIVLKIEEKK